MVYDTRYIAIRINVHGTPLIVMSKSTLAESLAEPDSRSQTLTRNLLMVNYRPQKFRGLLAPTQYASITRLSPAFRVRVWLRETTLEVAEPLSMAELSGGGL